MEEEERKSPAFGLVEPSEDPSAVATIGIAGCRLPSEQPASVQVQLQLKVVSTRIGKPTQQNAR